MLAFVHENWGNQCASKDLTPIADPDAFGVRNPMRPLDDYIGARFHTPERTGQKFLKGCS
jgi:hypothetical protein